MGTSASPAPQFVDVHPGDFVGMTDDEIEDELAKIAHEDMNDRLSTCIMNLGDVVRQIKDTLAAEDEQL